MPFPDCERCVNSPGGAVAGLEASLPKPVGGGRVKCSAHVGAVQRGWEPIRSVGRRMGMKRRQFLALLATAPLGLLAASCGSRTTVSTDGSTTVAPTTAAPTTTVPAGIAHPTGADDVVLRLAWEGGFVAPGFLFMRLPRLLVAGDGSVYVQGAQTEMYPQRLLPPVLVGTITEAEIQASRTRAESLIAELPEASPLQACALVALAERFSTLHRIYVIEDAAYREIRFDGSPSDRLVLGLPRWPMASDSRLGPRRPFLPPCARSSRR